MKFLKTYRAVFSRKIHFCQNLSKKVPEWPQSRFFLDYSKCFVILVFLGNNLQGKLTLLFIFHHHIWQNSGSRVMGENTISQSLLQDSLNYNILRKKRMMKFIFCMQINIEIFYKLILSFWLSVTRHAQSTPNKFAYLCHISIKAWVKLIFCLQINIKVFYKMISL